MIRTQIYNLRNIIQENLPMDVIEDSILDNNNEFKIYKMEIFELDSKKLLKVTNFPFDDNYYYIKLENEYFFISSDDLSEMNYYNDKTFKKEIIKGFFESQQSAKDSTKFFLKKNVENCEELAEPNDSFYQDIKLNLVSDKTVSFFGQNQNIPKDFFTDYFINAKLMSKGNCPCVICMGKDKENKQSTGTIHYPMEEKYYIKLSLIKGQFDGAFVCSKEFNLSDFGCDILFSSFDKILINQQILFEFKNSDNGEKEVISQALKQQENGTILFKNDKFCHILIIRSKILGDLVIKALNEEDKKKLNNFAILCMNSKLELCGQKIVKCDETTNLKKPKKSNYNSDSNNSKSSKSSMPKNHYDDNKYLTISAYKYDQNKFSLKMQDLFERLEAKIESKFDNLKSDLKRLLKDSFKI